MRNMLIHIGYLANFPPKTLKLIETIKTLRLSGYALPPPTRLRRSARALRALPPGKEQSRPQGAIKGPHRRAARSRVRYAPSRLLHARRDKPAEQTVSRREAHVPCHFTECIAFKCRALHADRYVLLVRSPNDLHGFDAVRRMPLAVGHSRDIAPVLVS